MNSKISVIMGIYNCGETLPRAIESIQKQTYDNWELIICDDGSADDSYQVALNYSQNDQRVRVIRNRYNQGLNKTLNKCLELADGEFIARMDGDDESVSYRFERQVEFLNAHKEFQLVSSPMILFDENGEWGKTTLKEYPQVKDIVLNSAICHAPVMIRKKCMDEVGGYTESSKTLRVEDVDLWIKLYEKGYRCYNFQEPLYKMRHDKDALQRRKYKYRVNSTYVRLLGCKKLRLDWICYIKATEPMIIGLIPAKLRQMYRKHVWKNNSK